MDNLEYLKMRKDTDDRKSLLELEVDIEYRKALALEIIAEELINIKAVLLEEGLRPYIRKIS